MRRVRWSVAVLLVVLAMGACGDDGDDTPPATGAPSTATTVAAPGTTTPTVDQLEATSVAVGDQHACALDADGQAWCWGYGEQGQLGDGTTEDVATPVAVDTDATFTQLTAGRSFTCGISTDGPTLCWGDNSRGQLGNGESGEGSDAADRPTPVQVQTEVGLTELAAGQLHVCALDEDDAAWCWGAYASGQLGVDVTEDQTTPVPVDTEETFRSLGQGGEAFTCGIAGLAEALCWGSNAFGQLGRLEASSAPQPTPDDVVGGGSYRTIAQGRTHACAVDVDDVLWCWGANDAGQLGDGTTDDSPTRVAVAGEHAFTQVTADDRFTCAVDDGGAAWCWGANVDGRLGDGSTDDATEPVQVTGNHEWAEVRAGEEFTCGRTTDDRVWCWGSNRVGWLGDGSDEDSAVPVPVTSP